MGKIGHLIKAIDAAVDKSKSVAVPGAVLGGALLGSEEAEAGPISKAGRTMIEAYHGSPHSFDKFSMDKIGTGEGAQAYGHGLYFADSEDVARGYKDALSRNKSITLNGETVAASSFPFGSPERQAIASFDGDAERTAKSLREYAKQIEDSETYIKAAEWLEENKTALRPGGSMYQVEIDASPDELLDWDKPLSEQSEAVQRAVREVDRLPDDRIRGRLTGKTNVGTELSGSNIYDEIQRYYAPNRSNIFDGGNASEGMRDASQQLQSLGVKGIRYKDGFSRGTDSGTSNYVIFDDKLISIAKKYGIALPVAGTALQAEQAKAAVTDMAVKDFAQRRQSKGGQFKALKDTIFEGMAAINRGVVDSLNFFGPDQVNALLQLSGSDKRVPDLYDIPGVPEATAKDYSYMGEGLARDIVRTSGEFFSPL